MTQCLTTRHLTYETKEQRNRAKPPLLHYTFWSVYNLSIRSRRCKEGNEELAKKYDDLENQIYDNRRKINLSNAKVVPSWMLDEDKTVVKTEKKVYPNDSCPCGSGKKYKKCCGKK